MRHTIFITDIRIRCVIGVLPEERRRRQPVRISVSMEVDRPELPQRDELSRTVDYAALHRRIVALAEGSAFNLIETLATRIAEVCLDDPRVSAAEATVEKPAALASSACPGVRVRMDRSAREEEKRHGTQSQLGNRQREDRGSDPAASGRDR